MIRKTLSLAALAFYLIASPALAAKSPSVVVSIKPIHSLVMALMQDVGTPHLLVEGENTTFNTKLTKEKMDLLANSDLIIWLGPELEGFLAEAMKNMTCNARKLEMLSSEVFKILPSRNIEGARDPFLWLDVRNAEVFVDEFYNALVAVDPANKPAYSKNREVLKTKMSKLDREFEYGFRSIAAGEGWAYHDTQHYFAQSYALHLNGHLSTIPGKPADMAKVLTTRNEMTALGKTCLFTEAGMTTDKLSLVTNGTGVVVAELDSFATGFKPSPTLYEDMMRHNFKAISDCFKQIGAVYTGPKVKLKKPSL